MHTDICFRLLLGPSHNHVKADLTAAVYPSWGPPTPPPLLLLAGNILERQAAPPPCLHHPTCHSRARCIALEPQEPSVAPYHPKDQAMLLSPAFKPSNPPHPMLPNQAPTDSSLRETSTSAQTYHLHTTAQASRSLPAHSVLRLLLFRLPPPLVFCAPIYPSPPLAALQIAVKSREAKNKG